MRSKSREAIEHMDPDRAMYGSAPPFHHPSLELAKVRVSGPSADLTDRVLGENGRMPFLGDHAFEIVV